MMNIVIKKSDYLPNEEREVKKLLLPEGLSFLFCRDAEIRTRAKCSQSTCATTTLRPGIKI